MCKIHLRIWQMSEAVADAISMLDCLLHAEVRGPGDMRAAMERLARRHKVPFAALWMLRYRPPKDIGVSVFEKLCEAYLELHEQQFRSTTDERAQTKAQTRLGRALLRAVAALDRADLPPLDDSDGV